MRREDVLKAVREAETLATAEVERAKKEKEEVIAEALRKAQKLREDGARDAAALRDDTLKRARGRIETLRAEAGRQGEAEAAKILEKGKANMPRAVALLVQRVEQGG